MGGGGRVQKKRYTALDPRSDNKGYSGNEALTRTIVAANVS